MKRKRSGVLFIIIGSLLAAVVGGFVYTLTSHAAQPAGPTESVVVAAQEIPERTVIAANAVTLKKMPIDSIPVGALKKTQEAVGNMSLGKIQVGEIVLASKLAETNGKSGISFTLERGKVLMTFPASNIIGLGLVRVGDSVDLLVTYKPAVNNNQNQAQGIAELLVPNVTQTTMQNLKVVTIGPASQISGQQGNQANNNLITFAMDPQDALFLKSMKDAENLVIEMALRAATDNDIHKTEPVTLREVLDRYGIKSSTEQSTSRR